MLRAETIQNEIKNEVQFSNKDSNTEIQNIFEYGGSEYTKKFQPSKVVQVPLL